MQQARKEAEKAVEQEEMRAFLSARRVEHNLEHKKKVEKEGRLMRRIARKSVKVRVFKPKPVRRPKNRVTILSVDGVPVEENEDEYTYF